MPDYQLYQGAWTGPEIDAAIGRSARISNPNLLDNWYFKNDGQFPINQRGAATITGDGTAQFFIDRWRARGNSSTTFTVKSTGLEIKSTSDTGANFITQYYKGVNLLNKTVTVTLLSGSGNLAFATFTPTTADANNDAYVTLDGTGIYIRIIVTSAGLTQVVIRRDGTAFTLVIAAIKMEIGNQQTLAHQEGTSWVLNETPIYEDELLRCQTSTADSEDTYANLTVIASLLGKLIVYEGTMPATAQAVRIAVAPTTGANGNCVLLGMVAKNVNNSWYTRTASMTDRDLRFTLESADVTAYGGQPYKAFILSM